MIRYRPGYEFDRLGLAKSSSLLRRQIDDHHGARRTECKGWHCIGSERGRPVREIDGRGVINPRQLLPCVRQDEPRRTSGMSGNDSQRQRVFALAERTGSRASARRIIDRPLTRGLQRRRGHRSGLNYERSDDERTTQHALRLRQYHGPRKRRFTGQTAASLSRLCRLVGRHCLKQLQRFVRAERRTFLPQADIGQMFAREDDRAFGLQ